MKDRINSARSSPLPKMLNWKGILNFVCLLVVMLSVQCCGGGGSGQTSPPDFNLGLSSGSISVTPGSTSQPVTLTVAGVNGFQGSVVVTVSGLPSGVTSSPASPFNISAGGNQAITFMASSSAAAGSATITFQGTSGPLNHSTSLTLQIVTSANFNLTISPSSISVLPGASSSPMTVSVSPLNGFSGTVSVTIQGLPTGVSTSPAAPFSVN